MSNRAPRVEPGFTAADLANLLGAPAPEAELAPVEAELAAGYVPDDGTMDDPVPQAGRSQVGYVRQVDEQAVEPGRLRNLLSTRPRKVAAFVLGLLMVPGTAAAAATGGFGLIPTDRDTCSDATHQLVSADRWSEISAAMSENRRYVVSEGRVRLVNPQAKDVETGKVGKLVQKDGEGKPQDELATRGVFCLTVPPPIASGQVEADGQRTKADISRESGVSVKTLDALNAGSLPKDNNQPIEAATVVWLTKKPDPSLIERPMTEPDLGNVVLGDRKLLEKVVLANVGALVDDPDHDGVFGFKQGDPLFLPYDETDTTDHMRDRGIKPAEVMKAYGPSYDHGNRKNLTAFLKQPTPTESPSAETGTNAEKMQTVPQPYRDIIIAAAKKHNTNAPYLAALILSEHDNRWPPPDTNWPSSPSGAQGLNQFIPPTWDEFKQDGNGDGVMDVQNIWDSIFASAAMAAHHGVRPDTPLGELDHPWQQEKPTLLRAAGWYSWGGTNVRDHTNSNSPLNAPGVPRVKAAYVENVFRLVDSGLTRGAGGDDPYPATVTGAVRPPSKSKQPEVTKAPGSIDLDPSKYNDRGRHLWVVDGSNPNHKEFYMDIGGQRMLLEDMSYEFRVRLIENALNGVNLSAEGYKEFVRGFQNDSSRIMAAFPNFNGSNVPNNKINIREAINYFVFHYTATRTPVNDMNAYEFARSAQSSGPVGSWGYINNKAQSWQTSEGRRVVNVYNHNDEALGVEIAAGGQETVTSDQYEAGVNMAVYFLHNYGFLQEGQSVTPIVNKMVRGHCEFGGDHTDFNKMVMDQIRPMIIQQLVNLGYKA